MCDEEVAAFVMGACKSSLIDAPQRNDIIPSDFTRLIHDSSRLIDNIDLFVVNAGTAIKVRPDGTQLASFSFKVKPGIVIEDINLNDLKSRCQRVSLYCKKLSQVEKTYFLINGNLEFRIQVVYYM
ncbi:MAG: hypothetical protein FuHV1_gp3 [Hangzhou hepevirus 1]|nr:MAG: hypothetical protein FuHV1_gp3 [Hangzhou hepevirus 1]